MEDNGVQHEVVKLGLDYQPDEFRAKFGKSASFPQVVLDNQHLGGLKDTLAYIIKHKLHKN